MSKHTRAQAAAGGPVFPSIPVTYTDFGDTEIWQPTKSRNVDLSVVGGGLLVAGNAVDPASSFRYGHAGAIGLMTIIPDANGEMDITSWWDSYVRPTDLAFSDDWQFVMGMWGFMNRMGYQGASFIGFGGLTGAGQDFASHGRIVSGTGDLVYITVFTTAGIATSFTMNVTVGDVVWPPGSVRKIGTYSWTVVGDGGVGTLGGVVAAGQQEIWHPHQLGIRPFIGAVYNENSVISQARCLSFTVNKGRVILGV